MKRKLVLENGKSFTGIGFGSTNDCVAELIFNTEMVGYQEVLANPVYAKKIVCMSYPLIGNYGLTDEDYESKYLKYPVNCNPGLETLIELKVMFFI